MGGKVKDGDSLDDKQQAAGDKYIDGGGESPGYRKVAKLVWLKQFGSRGGQVATFYSQKEWTELAETLETDKKVTIDERDEAIEAKGAQHRLRRLLNVLKNFGSSWEDIYTSTQGSL
ncbi:MAG: hypothetical protein CO108_21455 [Deltaproteobacteria bacterium CG_4_9_14_3_um_filter_63_12]|nr:MAG: hypothetical protein CO108_21455 [Deltaproteobacteria bacterium CG_4_9_14_3_um_filter_63_12]